MKISIKATNKNKNMGKRAHVPPADLQNYVTSPLKKIRSIRKRKVSSNHHQGNASSASIRPAKALRLNSETDDNNDDDDSSSNDTLVHNCSTKQASSVLLNSSLKLQGVENASLTTNESPRPVYSLRPSVVNGTILYDLKQKPWRLGNPIGKGNFGEIFLASDNITLPVTNENAKFVVKIEPHSNGPLFVEIHCILNTAKKQYKSSLNEVKQEEDETSSKIPNGQPSGIPDYIASGSHYFGDARYRFLVLQRFDQDLHSLIKNSCVSQKSLLTLAIQIVNVLENLHDKGYCHNDVKSQNLMISKCKYLKSSITSTSTRNDQVVKTNTNASIKTKYKENYDEKQPTTDSGNSSEQEANEDDYDDYDDNEAELIVKRRPNHHHYNNRYSDDDEDFNDGTTTTSNSNSNSIDIYKTPVIRNSKRRRAGKKAPVQYSGSNPVRSCRRPQRPNSIYEEMVNSHYLRPSKRISYSEFFADDGASVKGDVDTDSRDTNFNSTEDDDSVGFVPTSSSRRSRAASNNSSIKKANNNVQQTSTTVKNNSNIKAPPSSCKRLTRRQEKLLLEKQQQQQKSTQVNHFEGVAVQPLQNHHRQSSSLVDNNMVHVEAEHIFLIDFGLASKYIDNGIHRPFVMDQRRAHDGTLEFTSRDAHMGAHSRRSDLECLGYNLIFWSQGFLPWKEAAAQQQQEKVHRAKEYLMTDVREMLKQIYGKDVPKYLGEFLHMVGQLAYHERPEYARYRRLFEREYQQLGYSLANMCLDSHEIAQTCVRIKKDHGAGKHDFFELNNKLVNNNLLSISKCGITPFQERGSLGDRVSPKNLRSKSDKKNPRKKKFSWTEVLSQDPDQIARERAEKEFDREINDEIHRPVRRYQGKPTYAILELLKKHDEHKVSKNEKIEESEDADDDDDDDDDDDEENCAEEEDEENEDDGGSEEDDLEEGEEEAEAEESENDAEDSDASIDEEELEDEDEEEDEDEDFDMEDEEVVEDENISEMESEMESETETSTFSFSSQNKRKKHIGKSIGKRKSTERKKSSRRREESNRSSRTLSTSLKRKRSTQQKRNSRKSASSAVPQKKLKKSKKKYQRKSTAVNRQNSKKNSNNKQTTAAAAAASAAGEQQNDKQQLFARYLFDKGQNGNGNHKLQQKPPQNGAASESRSKRRCPIKTENNATTMLNNNGSRRLLDADDDNSNSNFNPDVRILFNIWNKMSNENIYAKSAAAVAAAKASNPSSNAGGGGGMVTRHYRK